MVGNRNLSQPWLSSDKKGKDPKKGTDRSGWTAVGRGVLRGNGSESAAVRARRKGRGGGKVIKVLDRQMCPGQRSKNQQSNPAAGGRATAHQGRGGRGVA